MTSVSEQFKVLPLALCDNEGLPQKGQKSFANTFFLKGNSSSSFECSSIRVDTRVLYPRRHVYAQHFPNRNT